jgi:hypothetical protein
MRDEIDSLVARLREGRSGERKAVLDRLVALGGAARPALERGVEEATFEGDVLGEALARIRDRAAAPAAAGPEVGLGLEHKHPVLAPWVESKYRLALDRYLAGDDLGALVLVDAILTIEPATALRSRLERLRHEVREHLVAETVLSVAIVPADPFLTPGKPLRAKLVLKNKTQEVVTLRSMAGSPLGQVTLDYEELQPDGTRVLRRTNRAVRGAEQGIALDPRASLEIELDVPSVHASKTRGVVGRYRLSGLLRPYTLLAGEEPLPYFLPLELVEVIVIDDEDRAAATKPEETFARALKDARAARDARSEEGLERATRTGFVAALVWASADRDAATAAIVKALETPSEAVLERMLTSALARAVGEPGSYTRDEWLEWWRTGASRPRSARPQPDGDDDPVGGAGSLRPRR